VVINEKAILLEYWPENDVKKKMTNWKKIGEDGKKRELHPYLIYKKK